jgi:hypothetical protein
MVTTPKLYASEHLISCATLWRITLNIKINWSYTENGYDSLKRR